MKNLKVGVIGAGGIAQVGHIPNYQKIEGVEVVALSDINEIKLKKVAKKFNIPKTFSDCKDLLKLKEIGTVSICTPNFLHTEQVIASLKAGKNVLCEKPLALKTDEVEKIIEEAKKSNKKFMVGFCHRFDATSKILRRFINRGELGEIYYVKASFLRRRGIPGLGGWFTTKKLAGGGPLIDVGVHILDLTLWLMGSPKPKLVLGSTYNKFKDQATDGGWPPFFTRIGDKFTGTFNVEDLATAMVKFENKSTLSLEASWAGNSETGTSISLFGTKGGAHLNLPGGGGEKLSVKFVIYKETEGDLIDIHPQIPSQDSYYDEISHFTKCIRENKEPLTKPKEMLNTVKIIEAIYNSAEEGKAIEIR